VIYSLVGTSLATQESVPAAFAVLSAVPGDPLAGLPAGRVARRGLRHDRGDGPAPSAAPSTASPPSRRTRSRSSTPRASRSPTWPIHSLRCADDHPERRGVPPAQPATPRIRGRGHRRRGHARPRAPPARRRRPGDVSLRSWPAAGLNVMAAATRQGLPVLYAGGHGTGPWGDVVRAALAAEGIDRFRPPDPDRDTGFDVALVEPDAERTFVTHLGAESLSAPGAWDTVPVGAGRRRLRVRLWPGRPGLRSRPRRLGRRPAVRRAAVRGPGPAGGADPGRGARSRPVPLRLAELQPPGGEPAH